MIIATADCQLALDNGTIKTAQTEYAVDYLYASPKKADKDLMKFNKSKK